MTPDVRNETLAALASLLNMIPDMRIGQMVAFLGDLSQMDGGRGLGDIEDDELLAVIRRHHAEMEPVVKARAASNAGTQSESAVA